ncbi:hypothetical protein VAEKB19_1970004 [Vibrio aestuarianus]|nr:hypothetical protein VAEKB19_1970004 [Vibrio aestuarianus]
MIKDLYEICVLSPVSIEQFTNRHNASFFVGEQSKGFVENVLFNSSEI